MAYPDRRVLFVSANSSGTAEMAEAWLRRLAPDLFDVSSTNLARPGQIHHLASRVMADCGLRVAAERPADKWWFLREHWDFVITLSDRSQAADGPICALVGLCIQWDCPDPALDGNNDELRKRAFESTAIELLTRVRLFVTVQARATSPQPTSESVGVGSVPPAACTAEGHRARRARQRIRLWEPARPRGAETLDLLSDATSGVRQRGWERRVHE